MSHLETSKIESVSCWWLHIHTHSKLRVIRWVTSWENKMLSWHQTQENSRRISRSSCNSNDLKFRWLDANLTFFFSRRHQKVAMLQVKRGQVAGHKGMKCQWCKQAMNFLVEVQGHFGTTSQVRSRLPIDSTAMLSHRRVPNSANHPFYKNTKTDDWILDIKSIQ